MSFVAIWLFQALIRYFCVPSLYELILYAYIVHIIGALIKHQQKLEFIWLKCFKNDSILLLTNW